MVGNCVSNENYDMHVMMHNVATRSIAEAVVLSAAAVLLLLPGTPHAAYGSSVSDFFRSRLTIKNGIWIEDPQIQS